MTNSRDDKELRRAVLDELHWDAHVDESKVDVGVEVGAVTLVGTVGSYSEKLAAQDAAAAVEGVHDLVNDIDVKSTAQTGPSDSALTVIVEQVLTWDALVPEQQLTASVVDGWITLKGHVGVDAQRREAELLVARLGGVRGITNEIEVAKPEVGPDDVRRAITDALRRRASHRADHIDVLVNDRAVTLRGTTQSALEKTAILGAVSHAPGIELVCDELDVDTDS